MNFWGHTNSSISQRKNKETVNLYQNENTCIIKQKICEILNTILFLFFLLKLFKVLQNYKNLTLNCFFFSQKSLTIPICLNLCRIDSQHQNGRKRGSYHTVNVWPNNTVKRWNRIYGQNIHWKAAKVNKRVCSRCRPARLKFALTFRCCPKIKSIYLLVRTKKRRDPKERLIDLFSNPVSKTCWSNQQIIPFMSATQLRSHTRSLQSSQGRVLRYERHGGYMKRNFNIVNMQKCHMFRIKNILHHAF